MPRRPIRCALRPLLLTRASDPGQHVIGATSPSQAESSWCQVLRQPALSEFLCHSAAGRSMLRVRPDASARASRSTLADGGGTGERSRLS